MLERGPRLPAFLARDRYAATGREVFIVSHNKCGTTSLKQYFRAAGWAMGNQKVAETLAVSELMDPSSAVSPSTWMRYISSARVFQDIPFSDPNFLRWLLRHYPRSSFIHVSRPSDAWYRSLVTHHVARHVGVEPNFDDDGSVIWSAELRRASESRPYLGYPIHEIVQARNGTTSDDPYNYAVLTAHHEFQQSQARALLTGRRSLLLELAELHDPAVSRQLADFVGLEHEVPVPHSNDGLSALRPPTA